MLSKVIDCNLGKGLFITASAEILAAHPYLNWNQANAIVKYRDQHGTFTSIDQLENIKILDKVTSQKVKPYLEIE